MEAEPPDLDDHADAPFVGADGERRSIAGHEELAVGGDGHAASASAAPEDDVVVSFDQRRVGGAEAVANVEHADGADVADDHLSIFAAGDAAAGSEGSVVEVVGAVAAAAGADADVLEGAGRVAGDDDAAVLVEDADAALADAKLALRVERAGCRSS